MYNAGLPGEDTRAPKFARIAIILLIVIVIALVILMGLQPPDSSTRDRIH